MLWDEFGAENPKIKWFEFHNERTFFRGRNLWIHVDFRAELYWLYRNMWSPSLFHIRKHSLLNARIRMYTGSNRWRSWKKWLHKFCPTMWRSAHVGFSISHCSSVHQIQTTRRNINSIGWTSWRRLSEWGWWIKETWRIRPRRRRKRRRRRQHIRSRWKRWTCRNWRRLSRWTKLSVARLHEKGASEAQIIT